MSKKTVLVMGLIVIFVTLRLAACSAGSKGDYRILYGKIGNRIASSGSSNQCKQFGFYNFEGAGIVEQNGSGNEDLKLEKFQMAFPQSKKFVDYYYIRAKTSPIKNMGKFVVYNWDSPNQILEKADFKEMKFRAVIEPSSGKFPSELLTSPDNKYLLYLMTVQPKQQFGMSKLNAYANDSDLVVKDLKSGSEKVVLKGNYNRALFESFRGFSRDGKAFFTVAREGNGFKFVKVDLLSGGVAGFKEVFPKFDWSKVKWNDYFPKSSSSFAHFSISPDESKLLVYTNDMKPSMGDVCAGTSKYKLEAMKIAENTTSTYSAGEGDIHGLTWNPDSQEFAFIWLSRVTCYPDYLDAVIYKMDHEDKEKIELVKEEKSKMMGIGWSPDEKKIAYGVYGADFIGWIKTVDPKNKIVKKVVSTKDIVGSVDKEKSVMTLNFIDWVAK